MAEQSAEDWSVVEGWSVEPSVLENGLVGASVVEDWSVDPSVSEYGSVGLSVMDSLVLG